MGFGEAVRTVYKDKYATFSGRASRSEYWYSFLFLFLVGLVWAGLIFSLGAFDFSSPRGMSGLATFVMIAGGLFYLAVFIPTLAVSVRRLHDRNMSGWWYLGLMVLSAVPYIGIVVSIGWLVLFCLKGTSGDNRFGPDPLRGGASAEVFA